MRPPVWNPPIELSASEQKIAQRIRKAKLFLFLRQIRHELFDLEFQQKLAKLHTTPWTFAISQDSRYPGSEGAKLNLATRLTIDYMDLVLKVLVSDPKVCQTFLEVLHMIESPAVLFHPSIAVKAIGQLVTVRQKAFGRAQN